MDDAALRVYCSSKIYRDYSLYEQFINHFETQGGYIQDLMWRSLPFILEQIVLSDIIVLHPDTGKLPQFGDSVEWLSESNRAADREAAEAFGVTRQDEQDAFFVSRYGLPYSGCGNHAQDLLEVAKRIPEFLARREDQNGRYVSSRVVRYIEREVKALNKSISRSLQMEAMPFEFPLLFYYIVDKAETYDDLFAIAFDLKASKEAIAYRKWCKELDYLLIEGYLVKAVRELRELKHYVDTLTGKVRTSKSWAVKVGFPPSVSVTHDLQIGHRRHLAFVRQLLEDTRLKEIAEKVIRLHKDSLVVDVPLDVDLESISVEDFNRYDGHWDDYLRLVKSTDNESRSASQYAWPPEDNKLESGERDGGADIDDGVPF